MIGFLSKIFGGNKSDKDVKRIQPLVTEINNKFGELQSISHDDLRNKTKDFRQRIKEYLQAIDAEIQSKKEEAEGHTEADLHLREAIYEDIDKLVKKRDEQTEEILREILPEAFAVMKETARRFKENSELIVTATDLDRELALEKDYVRIDGDKAIFRNTWEAAGNTVTWNMVHYDVQLIGGIVLHEGKIAEMATGEGKTLVSTLPSYLNA